MPAAFFAKADSGIMTPSDFVGRTVMVKTDSWKNRLELLLASNNLSLDDIVQVEEGDMELFINGEIEIAGGFVTNEVVQARLAGVEITTFPVYEYGVEEVTAVLYAHEDTLANQEDVAVRLTRATLKGWE